MKQYFLFDPNEGFIEFKTEGEALHEADKYIKYYLDQEWDEDVKFVCVGKITHRSTQCDYVKRPPEEEIDEDSCDTEGTFWSEFTHMCNYRLEENK